MLGLGLGDFKIFFQGSKPARVSIRSRVRVRARVRVRVRARVRVKVRASVRFRVGLGLQFERLTSCARGFNGCYGAAHNIEHIDKLGMQTS